MASSPVPRPWRGPFCPLGCVPGLPPVGGWSRSSPRPWRGALCSLGCVADLRSVGGWSRSSPRPWRGASRRGCVRRRRGWSRSSSRPWRAGPAPWGALPASGRWWVARAVPRAPGGGASRRGVCAAPSWLVAQFPAPLGGALFSRRRGTPQGRGELRGQPVTGARSAMDRKGQVVPRQGRGELRDQPCAGLWSAMDPEGQGVPRRGRGASNPTTRARWATDPKGQGAR